jgi:hypothetical protein
MMKVYADSNRTFATQLALDAVFVAWVIGWIWIGVSVHDATLELRGPGLRTESSATELSDSMAEAGGALDDVPYVGDEVATPFDKASDAAGSLADAGRSSISAVERLAFWLGFGLAIIPILLIALRYLPGRVRWVREATAGRALLDGPGDLELFALRALGQQPLEALARVSDDPAGAWRRGDAEVIARLADLELRAVGLRAG